MFTNYTIVPLKPENDREINPLLSVLSKLPKLKKLLVGYVCFYLVKKFKLMKDVTMKAKLGKSEK